MPDNGTVIVAPELKKNLRSHGSPHRMAWAMIYLLLAFSAIQFVWQLPTLYQWPRMDFAAYYHAAHLVRAGEIHSIYNFTVPNPTALGYDQIVSPYIYPPTVAVAMVPVTFVDFQIAQSAWFVIELLLLAHSVWLLLTFDSWRQRSRSVAVLFLLMLFNYSPVVGELCLGNINMLLLWLMVCALRLTVRRRDGAAGALLAVGFVIKVTPVVLLTYFVATRRWRAVLGFAATAAGILLLTLLASGPEPFALFVQRFGELSQGTPNTDNISFNGFFHRLLRDSEATVAPISRPDLILPLARTLGLVVFGASAVLVWVRREDPLYAFAVLATATSLASPVTWACHLVILLPAFFWLMEEHRVRLADSATPGSMSRILAVWILMGWLIIMAGQNLVLEPVRGLLPVLWESRTLYGLLVLWTVLMAYGLRLPLRQKARPEPEHDLHTSVVCCELMHVRARALPERNRN